MWGGGGRSDDRSGSMTGLMKPQLMFNIRDLIIITRGTHRTQFRRTYLPVRSAQPYFEKSCNRSKRRIQHGSSYPGFHARLPIKS